MIHVDITYEQNEAGKGRPKKIAVNLDTELRPVFIDLIKALTVRIQYIRQ